MFRHRPYPRRRWTRLIFWVSILGFGVYHVASAAIHILLVLALVSIVLHFVRGVGGTRRMV